MTVNVSDTLGYRLTSVDFTVHQPTDSRVIYSQVPRTAVVGQTFVLSVSVEANVYSLVDCSLYVDGKLVGNASGSHAVGRTLGHYVVSITVEVRVDVSGKHRATLVAADIACNESSQFVWNIDAFDAIVDVVVDKPTSAIVTGSTISFTARQTGGGGTITYEWDFGDQSPTVDSDIRSSSPAHNYTRPGTYTVLATASNSVSRVTGATTLTVVDTISDVVLVYDGPTTLGQNTFIKALVGTGTDVSFNFSTLGATPLARSDEAVMVRYLAAGQYDVTVLAQNAVSNGSASLSIYVVDTSTQFVIGVSNVTCGLPLRSVIMFHADVVYTDLSDVMFHWFIPGVLDSSGRSLLTSSASFMEAGVHELTLTVWNDLVGVRDVFRRQLCANETVPHESHNPLEPSIGVSRISAPYLPVQDKVVFFPVVLHCLSECSFYWRFWDSTPPMKVRGSKVQHAFRKTGSFNVSLSVGRLFTLNTTHTTVVVQRRIDKTSLQAAVEASSVGEPIEFVVTTEPDERQTGNLTYQWRFYDNPNAEYVGNSSTIKYAFRSEGMRHLAVTVQNHVSAVTANTSVNVCGKITGLSFDGCCGGVFSTVVEFNASVKTGQVSSYRWTLLDDEDIVLITSEEQVFIYRFSSAGHYHIQMSVENPLSNQTVVDYFTVQVSHVTSL